MARRLKKNSCQEVVPFIGIDQRTLTLNNIIHLYLKLKMIPGN